jgi:predicted RNA-binding protein YlqC (UPF0109 family)
MHEIEEVRNVVAVIVRSLVKHPENVIVEIDDSGAGTRLLIITNPHDAGMIVGKNGGTIRHIRALVSAISHRMDIRNLAVDVECPA